MKYHFQLRKEDTGYSSFCLELEGCRSEGDTMSELKKNLEEALNLYLDEPAGSNMMFPSPDASLDGKEGIIAVPVDPQIAFALMVRQARLARRMSQSDVQKALGMTSRNSYVRLESRTNPSLETIAKIRKVFPEISLDECFG